MPEQDKTQLPQAPQVFSELLVTYARTFNIGNYESIKVEIQEPVVIHGSHEKALLVATWRVLDYASKEVTRIRLARTNVSTALGPEPLIQAELAHITKTLQALQSPQGA